MSRWLFSVPAGRPGGTGKDLELLYDVRSNTYIKIPLFFSSDEILLKYYNPYPANPGTPEPFSTQCSIKYL